MKNYIGLALLFGSTLLSGMELNQIALNKELLKAAELGLKEKCEILIEKGANVNFRLAVLMVAAKKGHKEVCEVLIANGADVNTISFDGFPVLMNAAYEGQKEICELLIAMGAHVNAYNRDGETVLIVAVSNGHKEVCKLLIEKGADVNNRDRYKNHTALMWAAGGDQGFKEICELLLIHTLLRGSSRITTLNEAHDRIFTALVALEQKIELGHLPQDLLLVIISELKDDLFTLVAGRQGNMDKFLPILQKVVADCIISFLLSEEGKKILEEAQKNADIYEIKNLFNIEEVLGIFPGQLGRLVHQKMMASNSIQNMIK